MNAEFMPGITSVSSNALLLSSTVRLLQHVESLPNGASGALSFGEDGVILIEKKRICWAVASGMEQRLTDLLCQQHEPPLEREVVEQVFRRCKREGSRMGEALVGGGLLSESALRAALLRHTSEAIIRLAESRTLTPTRFAPHIKAGYDPRFVFTTAELLASLSGRRRFELAQRAHRQLAATWVPDTSGFAFAYDPSRRTPVIVAVAKGCELAVNSTLELATWGARTLELARQIDPGVQIVAATWSARITVVVWRESDVSYIGVCSTRAASAQLLSKLSQRIAERPECAPSAERLGEESR